MAKEPFHLAILTALVLIGGIVQSAWSGDFTISSEKTVEHLFSNVRAGIHQVKRESRGMLGHVLTENCEQVLLRNEKGLHPDKGEWSRFVLLCDDLPLIDDTGYRFDLVEPRYLRILDWWIKVGTKNRTVDEASLVDNLRDQISVVLTESNFRRNEFRRVACTLDHLDENPNCDHGREEVWISRP